MSNCTFNADTDMMSGRFRRADNILIVCLSFLFTLKNVHIRMKELFSALSVHLLLFIANKRKKNDEGRNENSIKYEIIYLEFKWEP